jgi:tryptophan synthase alpha chain
VSSAIKAGAAGAISGSATVNIIATNLSNTDEMHRQLSDFVRSMKAATQL